MQKNSPAVTSAKQKIVEDILKDLPVIKASKDFEEKLERKIKEYETKISKSKR